MSEKDDQMYVYRLFGISTPRKIKVDNVLRKKIGPGTKIEEKNIEKAQQKLDKPTIDFKPYAMEYLQKIEDVAMELKMIGYDRENEYNRLSIPVSQLKGQAGMFGSPFVSEISAKVLRFIEHYKRLDNDVLDIMTGYCNTVRLAYEHNITDIESPKGQKLSTELDGALNRYIAKFRRKTET